jgi:hypothetical protein
MIYFAVDEPRVELLTHYLDREWGLPLRERMGQMTYPELFRTRRLPRGAWIFTSLDALTDAELWMVHHIQSAVRDAGLPVLNPAREALHRFELLERLYESGSNDFRAHRADGPLDTLRFPVFVREADAHTGSLTPLLHDRVALRRAMMYLWLRGLPRRQLLVIEFCETASADGLFRKYSIFRIGDTYIPRYIQFGEHWMTKSHTSRTDEPLVSEEMDYLRENPHADWVREVFEMAHIEYGRLDYGLRDGRPQAWEINFTPVLTGNPIRPMSERTRALTHHTKEYAHAGLRRGFEGIDPGPMPGGDIRVEFPPALEEQARRERRAIRSIERRQQWISRIAAGPGLRGVGPLLRRTFRG